MTHLLLGAGRGSGSAGGGGSSITSPTDLTGLIGWWDASVFASLSLTGSDINTVADQSGGGNTLSWAGYNKPKYHATALNGMPCFKMNAVTEAGSLRGTSFPMGTGNTLTAWSVCTLLDPTVHFGANDGRLFSYAAPTTSDFNSAGSWCLTRPAHSFTALHITRNSTVSIAAWTSGPSRLIWTVDSGGVMKIYVDGVLANTSTGTSSGNWISGGAICIGQSAQISDNFWDGPIGECGVATGYHDATDVAALDSYLQTKWGL